MSDLTFYRRSDSTFIAVRVNTDAGLDFMERYYGDGLGVNSHNEYLVPILMEGEVRQAARFQGVTVEDRDVGSV